MVTLRNPPSDATGGHSGWLDLLGFYGLFTAIPLFFIFYFNINKHSRFYKNTNFYGFFIVMYFLFLIFGMINPILYVFVLGFVVFCIVPAIPFISHSFNKKIMSTIRRDR